MFKRLWLYARILLIVALIWGLDAVINYRKPYPVITYNITLTKL